MITSTRQKSGGKRPKLYEKDILILITHYMVIL